LLEAFEQLSPEDQQWWQSIPDDVKEDLNDMAKVTLVSWTNKPLQVIHAMTQNMMGNIITDLDSIKEEVE